MSIWLIVPLALFLGSVYGIYLVTKKRKPARTSASCPSGVGGWLLLLVTGLIVLGPLMGAARINAEFSSADALYPSLVSVSEWGAYKSVSWWSFLAMSCLSLYAGIGLLRGRSRVVVKRAKILLWVVGPVSYVVMGVIIPWLVLDSLTVSSQLFGGFMASFIITLIWTLYLSRSKRVKATYGVDFSTTGS